jgi:hypothetical protein
MEAEKIEKARKEVSMQQPSAFWDVINFAEHKQSV